MIGSRDDARAAAAAEELGIDGATNADACSGADLVVLATKADAALATAEELHAAIGATPVLSVAAELSFEPVGVVPSADARSLAARLQEVVEGPVVAGLHSLAARNLGGDEPPEEDALVCGDDADAKQVAVELSRSVVGRDGVDAGALRLARQLEPWTAVLISINKKYKVRSGVLVSGLQH